MYILKVRENANSPWQLIDVLVGPRGKDGHTPIKGVDYFTQEDIDFIVAEVEKGNYATVEYVDSMIENIPEVDLSNYYTKEQVDQAISADLGDYALKTDLTGLATEEYVEKAVEDVEVDLTGYAKTADLATVATTGNYNDLANLPTIPSTTGLATEEYVNNKVSGIDLSEYAKTTDIPSLDGYATEEYVGTKIAEAQLGEGEVDLSNYYTKSEVDALIPSTTGFITMADVEEKGYLTEHQDLSAYALKTEIPDVSGYALKTEIPSVEGLATEKYVDTAIDNIELLQGPKGEDGDTPIKGVDYYTETEIEEIVAEIKSAIFIFDAETGRLDIRV